MSKALGVITLVNQPPEGDARYNTSLRVNKKPRTNIGIRSVRNRHPRISKNGIRTDRTMVSVSPAHGKPSNHAVIPDGSPNTDIRRKAPRANLKKTTGELSLLGGIQTDNFYLRII